MKVVQAYRFALDPSPAQERMLRSHAGAARFAWNWGLAKCNERYAAERKWYSAAELHKLWNAQKKADPGLAWWPENSKCAYQEAFRNLDRALRDYVKSSKGGRKGRRLGVPHKATTALAARYETVVVEDLNVAGMVTNRRLARAIADQGFGVARRMLGYKTARQGGTLMLAGRWYPSSKRCSGCGSVKAKLTLAERVYRCGECGLVADRDVNAARNLLLLAASGADSLNACGAAVRPGLTAGRAALKQEPGTAANAGQTGTAAHPAATV